MSIQTGQLIAGAASAESNEKFQAVNPATGETLPGDFHEATEAEVGRAVEAAASAAREYRAHSADDRAAFLRAIAEHIDAAGDALTERGGLETGLPAGRLNMERGRTVNQLRMFADVVEEGSWVEARIDTADADRKPLPKPDLRRMLLPIGPVAVFGASNFPLAFSVCGGDTASALAAGNPVVVKAHPAHPGVCAITAAAVMAAVEDCGMPKGVFSMVHGKGNAVGMALVTHPATRAVGFTGSLRGGRALMDAAAARPNPIPVYAEMGSTNPVFILPKALAARGKGIADGLVGSVNLGAGQFCTNPGIVVALAGADFDAFASAAGEAMAASAASPMLHAGICASYLEGVGKLAASDGVTQISSAPNGEGTAAGGTIFKTDGKTFLQSAALREEVFGPATLLVACASKDEMLDVAHVLHGNLTATIHADAEDLPGSAEIAETLGEAAGRLLYNGFPTGVEVGAAMHHGGPYPATSNGMYTSVGTAAIARFARPLCYQNAPHITLPPELRDENPRAIYRLVNGTYTNAAG